MNNNGYMFKFLGKYSSNSLKNKQKNRKFSFFAEKKCSKARKRAL